MDINNNKLSNVVGFDNFQNRLNIPLGNHAPFTVTFFRDHPLDSTYVLPTPDETETKTWLPEPNQSSLYETAKRCTSLGISVIPLIAGTKRPAVSWKEYQDRLPTEDELYQWFVTLCYTNLAIVTGKKSGIFVVDCDSPEAYKRILNKYNLSKIPTVKSPNGYHLYFKYNDSYNVIKNRSRILENIDVRTNGGYIIVPPSTLKEGGQYKWINLDFSSIDQLLPSKLFDELTEASKSRKTNSKLELDDLFKKIRTAPQGKRNDTLNEVAFTIGHDFVPNIITEESAKNKLIEIASSIGLESNEINATINSGLSAGTQEQNAVPDKPSDIQLAEMVINNYPDICFCDRGWMIYSNGIWLEVKSNKISNLVLTTIKEKYGVSFKLTKTKLNSIIEMMKATKEICVDADKFDSNNNKIVLENGVLDITTNEFEGHYKDLYATISLNYHYDPDAKAHEWKKYLNNIFANDSKTISFLQEYAGYCLTKDTSYELAVWLYGPPGGGKSTFVEGIKAMLGSRVGTLGLARLNNQFSLSSLVGKSLMISTEQPSQYIKSTDILNSIISGEIISVERKYKEAYDYRPYAKILWACNELPRIRSGSNGLFRRVKIVEFPKISSDKLDPDIKKNIMKEGQGILIWALEGLKRLLERAKFEIPESIQAASKDFKLANDSVARFIEEKCLVGEGNDYCIQSSVFYSQYIKWSNENHQNSISSSRFASELKSLGYVKKKGVLYNYWLGLKLNISEIGLKFDACNSKI